MKPKVLLVVLVHTGWIHKETTKLLLRLVADPRVELSTLLLSRRPVEDARNACVAHAKKGKFDYLISVDHDVACKENILDLCFCGKDIIICPTPIFQCGRAVLNIHYEGKLLADKEGIAEVDKGGTGCICLSRKALETIPEPLFLTTFKEHGEMDVGEDIYFCEKARSLGFTIYAHTKYPCSHFQELDLWNVFANSLPRAPVA